MKDVIKGKGNKWVAAQIKDYKLVIPEHHTFFSLKPFYSALGIKAAVALEKGEYQTNLKPPPKKIALYCEELDQFQNEIDSQPSTRLFSVDVDKNNTVHYNHLPCTCRYLPHLLSIVFTSHF